VHEMGVTQEILGAVIEASTKAGATRVNTVRLTVGALTALVPDSLQFAWECLTPGTLAEGAVLEINETPGRSRCLACGSEFDHDQWDYRCTTCGGMATELIAGHQLSIDNLDVDLPDSAEASGE
jgi:hydrogenase nickel incorporation protein HypA/HybF